MKTKAWVSTIRLNARGLPVAMTVRCGRYSARFAWRDVAGDWSRFTRRGYDGDLGEMSVAADAAARALLDAA